MNENRTITIEDLKAMEKELLCKFDTQKTGSPEWIRMFIINSKGRTIGRCNFKNNALYSIRAYKKDYIRTTDETDRIILLIGRYVKDQTIISLDVYIELVLEAMKKSKQDLAEKIAWRKANPKLDRKGNKKGRPRLEGKNPRYILAQLMMDY